MIQSTFPCHQVTVAFKNEISTCQQSGHVSNNNNLRGRHHYASYYYSFSIKKIAVNHIMLMFAMGVTVNPGRSISIAESSNLSLLILQVMSRQSAFSTDLLPLWRSYSSCTLTITTQVFSILAVDSIFPTL